MLKEDHLLRLSGAGHTGQASALTSATRGSSIVCQLLQATQFEPILALNPGINVYDRTR